MQSQEFKFHGITGRSPSHDIPDLQQLVGETLWEHKILIGWAIAGRFGVGCADVGAMAENRINVGK
jgi:hypothetical protein